MRENERNVCRMLKVLSHAEMVPTNKPLWQNYSTCVPLKRTVVKIANLKLVLKKAFTLKNMNTPIKKKAFIVIGLEEPCKFLWQHSMHERFFHVCRYLEKQQKLLEALCSSMNPHSFQAFHCTLCSELDPFTGILENLVDVAQALSLKYPDKECCHSRKYVPPLRTLFEY